MRKYGLFFIAVIIVLSSANGCTLKNFRFRKYKQEGIVRKIKLNKFYGDCGTVETLSEFQRYMPDGIKHRIDFSKQMIVVATSNRYGYMPIVDILRVEREPDRLVVVYEVRKKPLSWLKPRQNYCIGSDAAVIRKTGLPVDFRELP